MSNDSYLEKILSETTSVTAPTLGGLPLFKVETKIIPADQVETVWTNKDNCSTKTKYPKKWSRRKRKIAETRKRKQEAIKRRKNMLKNLSCLDIIKQYSALTKTSI